MSIFSDDDRTAWAEKQRRENEEYTPLARRIAAEMMEDLTARVRQEYRAHGQASYALVRDTTGDAKNGPWVPPEILEGIMRTEIERVFMISASSFSVHASSSKGDYISGTYDDHYTHMRVRVDFNPPLH